MYKLVNGQPVELSKDEQLAFEAEWELNKGLEGKVRYRDLRLAEYPTIGDQLDALMKQFQFTTIPVSPEYQDIINKCMAVKKKYPKP